MGPYDALNTDWLQDGYPLSGSAFQWGSITDITIHYTGGSLPPTPKWQAAWLRAMNRDWWNRRNYSVGYNAVVFPNGDIYEMRGDERRCAANGSVATNTRAFAILVPVVGDGEATPEAVSAVRQLVAWIRTRRPHALINGHTDVRATPCPGAGLLRQVRSGTFEPVKEGNDMTRLLWKDDRYADTFLVFPTVTALAPKLAEVHIDEGGKLVTERHSGVLKAFARSAGITKVTRSDGALVDVESLEDGER